MYLLTFGFYGLVMGFGISGVVWLLGLIYTICYSAIVNSLGVENALYTLYKVDEHLSILLTRKGSRNRQITLFISQRCIISIAKQICFVNTTYGSKT